MKIPVLVGPRLKSVQPQFQHTQQVRSRLPTWVAGKRSAQCFIAVTYGSCAQDSLAITDKHGVAARHSPGKDPVLTRELNCIGILAWEAITRYGDMG